VGNFVVRGFVSQNSTVWAPDEHFDAAEMVCRDIMYQLCQAMAYIHRLGIVHRNLKLDVHFYHAFLLPHLNQPVQNILLSGDTIPFIKIAGFGLAAHLSDGSLLTVRRSFDTLATKPHITSGHPRLERLHGTRDATRAPARIRLPCGQLECRYYLVRNVRTYLRRRMWGGLR
jgi:serine/threonine protein kinase